MAPDSSKHRLWLVFILIVITGNAKAGDPDYINTVLTKNFCLNTSIGYGVTNSLLKNKTNADQEGGVVIDFSLEYRLSKMISFSFGPYFWIEQNDFAETNNSAGQNASDRRMMVTLQSHFKPFSKMPLTFSAGIGMGTAMYAGGNSKVTIDTKQQAEAEYHGGTALTASLSYPFKIKNHLLIAPIAGYKTLFFNGSSSHMYDRMKTNSNAQIADISLKAIFEF